ncbi:MAG: restriction endonuclease subunit S [Planctomycetes bacterium]|nr:restriction endonuclease subunit S [Planctomycetota bacterium]
MSFPRYPKYKPSGVEWLGEVPEHWGVKPIRKAARLESGHTPSRNHPEYWENCTVPWFTLADVWQIREARRDVVIETKELISELGLANSAARRLPAGTVMLSRTASVGFSAIMGVEMATTQDFANWVCGDELLPKFLLHAFRSMQGEFRRLMMGSTHNTIYMPDIQAFRLALPPLPEQRAIAAFLDRETAKIDALIAEQEKLIELLAEKRQAVISHAVTKGLNPAAPMKPSGVEWLGDVPAHWKVLPIHRLVQQGRAITYGIVQPGQGDPKGRYMIRGQDYSAGWAEPDQFFRVSAEVEEPYRRARVRPRDIVMTIVGAGVGNVAVVPNWLDGANLTQTTARVAIESSTALPEFIHAALRSSVGRGSVGHYAKGAAQPGLNIEHVRVFPIPVPPLPEQASIVEALSRTTTDTTVLDQACFQAVGLLRERRSALISAAVTGQIDVRNVVPETAA